MKKNKEKYLKYRGVTGDLPGGGSIFAGRTDWSAAGLLSG